MSKWTKTRLNKLANNIQKEKIVYVSQMGSSVHAQGPYKHLTPGNPDFQKRCKFSVFSHSFGKQFPQKLRWQAVKWKLRLRRRRERGDGFSLPLPSTPSSSRFLSPLGEPSVSPLSFTPQCWQTGQTSWVGPWCQWVGTAAEVKRNRGGRRKGDT